jgi:hypothetical protein
MGRECLVKRTCPIIFGRLLRTKVRASDLAELLYQQCVLEDEPYADQHLLLGQRLDSEALRQRVFLYLVASIILALTWKYRKDPRASGLIPHIKGRAADEARRRWSQSEDYLVEEVDTAAIDLEHLLSTDPNENRALSFEWAQAWLAKAGHEECNPGTLFAISFFWQNQYIALGRMLERFRIVPD